MAIQVLIPTPLQAHTNHQAAVSVEANSVAGLITCLEETFPGMRGRIRDEEGKLRRFLNIYVNSEDIRFLNNDATPLSDGDEVSIVPAVAGG
ncbi:MAG: MoaD/ThiS family protein [Cyanobacteriota bacterium]|jgi:molybdopterin synthase sulfur carrier subunit